MKTLKLTIAAKMPAKYVGEDVSITKTDQRDKRIAQGRVAKITHIYDHLAGQKFDIKWILTKDTVPRGFLKQTDTTTAVEKDNEHKWARTVVLDGNTEIAFRSNQQLNFLLKPAKCCTVHQAQGRQGNVLFSIQPLGLLSNVAIFYTSSSRARKKCITLTTEDVFETMKKTEPPKSVSILQDLFEADENLQNVMRSLKTTADAYFADYLLEDNVDNNNNNNNNNNNDNDMDDFGDFFQ